MRIPTWLLSLSLALLCTQIVVAQQATPEQIQDALELLRNSQPTPTQPAKQPVSKQPAPVEIINPEPVSALPTVVTPAPSQPATQVQPTTLEPTTSANQQKALELLRSIETASPAPAPAPAQTTVQPAAGTQSDQDREAAIRSAIQEAEIISQQQKNARQQNPAAASEAQMQAEISRIEAEILKAKGAQPSQVTPVTPVTTYTPQSSTTTITPVDVSPATQSPTVPVTTIEVPAASVPAQTIVPATRLTPATTAQPSASHPELIPMTAAEEMNARRLLNQTAIAPSTQKPTGRKPTQTVVPQVEIRPPVVPKPALSGSKEEKLAQLLRAYVNDEISPADYHKERAKILTGP